MAAVFPSLFAATTFKHNYLCSLIILTLFFISLELSPNVLRSIVYARI